MTSVASIHSHEDISWDVAERMPAVSQAQHMISVMPSKSCSAAPPQPPKVVSTEQLPSTTPQTPVGASVERRIGERPSSVQSAHSSGSTRRGAGLSNEDHNTTTVTVAMYFVPATPRWVPLGNLVADPDNVNSALAVCFGVAEDMGRRHSMEDRVMGLVDAKDSLALPSESAEQAFFGVYDGMSPALPSNVDVSFSDRKAHPNRDARCSAKQPSGIHRTCSHSWLCYMQPCLLCAKWT